MMESFRDLEIAVWGKGLIDYPNCDHTIISAARLIRNLRYDLNEVGFIRSEYEKLKVEHEELRAVSIEAEQAMQCVNYLKKLFNGGG